MRLIEHLFSLIAPHDCLVCGKEGSLICMSCSGFALTKVQECCYRCYRVSPSGLTCPACRHHSVLRHVWVRTSYDGVAKELMHGFKFGYAKESASVISKELLKVLPVLSGDFIIVHIPAATSHIRERGFDQSALIARELSNKTGLIHINCLSRVGQQHQVGSTAQTRKQQMANAFRVINNQTVKAAHILLVDDVVTTGSTLEAAALTLKRAGAASVSAVCFAQVK